MAGQDRDASVIAQTQITQPSLEVIDRGVGMRKHQDLGCTIRLQEMDDASSSSRGFSTARACLYLDVSAAAFGDAPNLLGKLGFLHIHGKKRWVSLC